MIQPNIQTGQILAGTLTLEFDMDTRDGSSLKPGPSYPENVVVFLTNSAMSAGETLNFFGQSPGMSGYADTVLCTEIDINAAASTTVRQVLASATTGPLEKLKLVALNIAAAETIDFVVISW